MNKKSSTELIDLIIAGKSKQLEFCDENLDDANIAKHLVAMANSEGGYLVFGIDDNGEILGLTYHEVEHRVADITANIIFPGITPEYYEVKLTGKIVGVVEVAEGADKPYYFSWQGNQNYTIRSGKISRKITASQLQNMLRKGGGLRYELTPVGNATLDDLDKNRLGDFLKRTRKIQIEKMKEKELVELLHQMDIAVQLGKKVNPTVLGLLMFGKNPTQLLNHTKIQMLTFNGPEKSQESLLMEVNEPLIGLFKEDSNEVLKNGAVEGIMEIISEHLEEANANKKYPLKTIKELVLNALIHRNYSDTDSQISIQVFTDHIDITSPGHLTEQQTLDKIKIGQKSTANSLLYSYMAEAGYFNKNELTIYNLFSKNFPEESITDFKFEPGDVSINTSLYFK